MCLKVQTIISGDGVRTYKYTADEKEFNSLIDELHGNAVCDKVRCNIINTDKVRDGQHLFEISASDAFILSSVHHGRIIVY